MRMCAVFAKSTIKIKCLLFTEVRKGVVIRQSACDKSMRHSEHLSNGRTQDIIYNHATSPVSRLYASLSQ